MDLVGTTSPYVVSESESLRYYRLALSAIRTLLLHPEYAQSDEMLAACILYEMIDVVGESLGSHLTGVASLLRTRQVHGNVAGIRGACYWTWYRHETWAALRTGRQMSIDETYWEPESIASFSHLTPEDVANRVIFIFGQCINYCNDDTTGKPREAKAAELDQALDDWKAKLPSSMTWFSTDKPEAGPVGCNHFEAMWFVFPHSAVANQVYNASKIILALNRRQETASAALRGLADSAFLSTQRRIEWHRRQIFLTANAGIPDAWSLVSSQCLYIAGLVTKGVQERQKTLDLIDQCQRSSGRKTGVLSNDLRNLWATEMEVF
ncbi:unnamed protein product [Clonostachys rosea]|uniref:Transcription factor domain-containing protein n=1 Tax=Bionectria ochroleuca TaxID=29856 RepID=A0ABY6UZG3_BIOOC|nr:unnamed protein product [Clonostachys rosea]